MLAESHALTSAGSGLVGQRRLSRGAEFVEGEQQFVDVVGEVEVAGHRAAHVTAGAGWASAHRWRWT